MRILLVEDDPMVARAIVQALKDAAYAVDLAADSRTALAALALAEHDAVLLDLGLPDEDGLTVLGRLRAAGNPIPVLVITARSGIQERVQGLDVGADDYLAKPFDVAELLARLRAVCRRARGRPASRTVVGQLMLDLERREAEFAGRLQSLSPKELALLEALTGRPGAILSRRQIDQALYVWNEEVESNAVEFLIHSVRRKLGAAVIKNVRGVGWRVDGDPETR